MWMVVRLLPVDSHATTLPSALSVSRFGATAPRAADAGRGPSSGPAATAGAMRPARKRRAIAGASQRLGVVVGSFILGSPWRPLAASRNGSYLAIVVRWLAFEYRPRRRVTLKANFGDGSCDRFPRFCLVAKADTCKRGGLRRQERDAAGPAVRFI